MLGHRLARRLGGHSEKAVLFDDVVSGVFVRAALGAVLGDARGVVDLEGDADKAGARAGGKGLMEQPIPRLTQANNPFMTVPH